MKKLVVLLIAFSGALAACAPIGGVSPYAYSGQQRNVVSEFCPPKQAVKGMC